MALLKLPLRLPGCRRAPCVPVVVGTVTTLAGLKRLFSVPALPCDWVEVRFDLLGLNRFDQALELLKILRHRRIPLLGTFRSAREGGKIDLSDEDRLEYFKRLLPWVHIVDVEGSSPDLVRTICRGCDLPMILSYHHFETTPSLPKLLEIVAPMLKVDHALVKVACRVDSPRQLLTLTKLIEACPPGRLAAMGMGRYGEMSRTWLPERGSVLTYGFLDRSAASGQVPVGRLYRHFHPPIRSAPPPKASRLARIAGRLKSLARRSQPPAAQQKS
ncbi:MAG: type I 3-dehydroquinate dehydratase [Verrucomicrobiae bacterium]|nr:type I 3-dehydroquinate dehydratase [Verrucomicrobiae bacterium]